MADLLSLALLVLLLSITDLQGTGSQGTCSLHDIENGVSQGTHGFPSQFHIEVLEGQADLHRHSSRQVLIPAMTFNCTGRVTKWIVAAKWGEDPEAFLRLQTWTRASSVTNTYTRTGTTTVLVNAQISSEVYEIPLINPLAFRDGDIVGYFQPHTEIAQLNLYLEDSEIITTYRDNVDDEVTQPPSPPFNLDTAEATGKDYPLIAVETDPSNCGCGFVTLDRINTLLTTDRQSFGPKTFFTQEQVIFPGTRFTESGHLLKWIVGGTYMTASENFYPELQLWRPTGSTRYQKLNGTIIAPPAEIRSGIYEFPIVDPFPFQPGDVLGVFQPSSQSSKLLVDYDGGEHANNFFIRLSSTQRISFHTSVDVSTGWETGTALALVSVVIALDVAATTTTVPLRPATTTTVPLRPATTTTVPLRPATTTTVPLRPATTTTVPLRPATTFTEATAVIQTTPLTIISSTTSVITMAATPNTVPVAPTSTSLQAHTTTPLPVTDTLILNVPSISTPLPDFKQPAETSALPPLKTTTLPVVVNSASAATEQGLMFYVSLGVVGTMLAVICVLIVVLVIAIKSPRKKAKNSEQPPTPAVHVNLETGSSVGYEMYTDTTPGNVSSSAESQSPNCAQPIFDNSIYNSPEPADLHTREDMSSQIQSESSSTPAIVSAYAVSNVHCTTMRALPTIREQSDDYDYADP